MSSLRRALPWLLIPIWVLVSFNFTNVVLANADSSTATSLTLSAPPSAALGDPIRFEATLRDNAGMPIAQAAIRFYSPATFLSGASGLMRIGEATTNAQGVATFEYISRRGGEIEVLAEYQGDNRYAPSKTTMVISVEGNEQLYEAETGIRVPYISKWLLVGFLSAVWGTIFFVVLLVVRIALAPQASDEPSRRR